MAGAVQMTKKMIIAPSILGADPLAVAQSIDSLENEYDWIHVDIMDGRFVPNLSFGSSIVKAIRGRYSDAFIDVHLMVDRPENMLDDFINAGSSLISFHAEATPHIHRVVQRVRDAGVKAGISVTPSTPSEILFPMLPFIDLVLVMSVNPGFGGQSFLDFTLDKLRVLACRRAALGLDFLLEMDGGISADNAQRVVECGCDVLVMGSALFKQANPAGYIRNLKKNGGA